MVNIKNQKTIIKKSLYNDKKIIKLASKKLKINIKKLNDNLNFPDSEDQGYIHRWSWALNLNLKKPNINNKKFIESAINNWFFYHQNISPNTKKIEWYPYNISERISNYAVLCELNILKKNEVFCDHLTYQMYFLTKNIELYKNKISNHALNNARAIFLHSCHTKNKIFKEFSINLILYLCNKFIDKQGFFKFGSSHYQFIFTKWLLEICYFGTKYKEKKINKIKKYLNSSLKACNFFVQKKNSHEIIFPLFGNISPDFTPSFLINYFQIFFKKLKMKNLLIKNKNQILKSKEWFKLYNKNQTIYFRNPMINGFDFNHAHSDFFHFVNFYKKMPIFIDLGRKNYLKKNFKYLLANAHNSIIADGYGVLDSLITKNILTKTGIINIGDKKYSINESKNKITFKTSLSKKFKIERSFKIEKKSLVIKNIFQIFDINMKIDMPFFLDNKIKVKRIDKKNFLLRSSNFKSVLNIQSSLKNYKIELKENNKSKYGQCKNYGESENSKYINISCFGKSNFNLTMKLEF